MDVYADEKYPYDQDVFWADGFLDHLEGVQHNVKLAAKRVDKRTMGELRVRADEALLNLGRFLQYKKKHRPSGIFSMDQD
jgi:hypothetical protein